MLGNILVLTPIRKGSGNLSTATRIVNSLNGSYKNVYLKNSLDYDAYNGALHRFCIENQIIVVVIIHAYYSGRLFFNENNVRMPIICIFGGTDLHTPLKFWLPVIEKTMQISKYLICFSDELKKLAYVQYKNVDEKCFIIPQGVDVFVTNGIFLNDTLNGLFSNNRKVITWAGCIRKIKDPLFIEPILKHISHMDDKILFVYIGFPLDVHLTRLVEQLESNNSNFKYINGLDREITLTCIGNSWAYLNTSINEGMALALLEAMKLRVPVLARANPGNCSIVKDKSTGLLFSNQTELQEAIGLLACDLRMSIISNAFTYVNTNHSVECEQSSYLNIINNALQMN